jgi:hypothetical protein
MADIAGQYIDELLSSGKPFPSIDEIQAEISRRSGPTNNRERQFAARRAMSGRDPSLSTADREAVARRASISEENNQAIERGVGELVLGQPIRAGRAIGEAYEKPSIANLTAAGAHTALAAFRPMTAGAFAVGGMGAAAASDLADEFVSDAGAQQRNQPNARARAANAERSAAREKVNLLKTENAKAADDERRRIDALDRNEYDAAVSRAEAEKNAILADKPKRFGDTAVGEVYNKLGMIAPGVIAAGMGGVSRLGSAALGYNGKIANYAAPAAVGAVTGGVSASWPLGHELLFEPAANPERRAYEAYARELPPTHPRKQEWTDYALRQPEANPARNAASEEFYNPTKFMERTGVGVAEGVLGGLAGSEFVNTLRHPIRASNLFGGANRGAGGGSSPGGPPGAGANSGPNFPPLPQQPPQGGITPPSGPMPPTYPPYDPLLHGPVARQYLDDALSSGRVPETDTMVNQLQGQFVGRGWPQVDPANLAHRARGTVEELMMIDQLLRSGQMRRTVTGQEVRQPVLNASTGRDYTLAVPAAALPAAGYYGMPEQPPNALMQHRADQY